MSLLEGKSAFGKTRNVPERRAVSEPENVHVVNPAPGVPVTSTM
ncbi:MAG: hypothetical protein AB4041_04625 [Microcystaceae cyanobacterium]